MNSFLGSIKNEEAEMLYQLVLHRKPKIAYQIGTFLGYSALVIAHALRANGDGILVAIDPEIPHNTFINPVNIAREVAKAQALNKYIRFDAVAFQYAGLCGVGLETPHSYRRHTSHG